MVPSAESVTCSTCGVPYFVQDVHKCVKPPTSKATDPNPKNVVGMTKVSISKIPPVALVHCALAMMDGDHSSDLSARQDGNC